MPFLAQCAAELEQLAVLSRRRVSRDPEVAAIARDELSTGLERLAERLRNGPGTGRPAIAVEVPMGAGRAVLDGPIVTSYGQVLVCRVRRPRAKSADAR